MRPKQETAGLVLVVGTPQHSEMIGEYLKAGLEVDYASEAWTVPAGVENSYDLCPGPDAAAHGCMEMPPPSHRGPKSPRSDADRAPPPGTTTDRAEFGCRRLSDQPFAIQELEHGCVR